MNLIEIRQLAVLSLLRGRLTVSTSVLARELDRIPWEGQQRGRPLVANACHVDVLEGVPRRRTGCRNPLDPIRVSEYSPA
jgi:hypothetical protein